MRQSHAAEIFEAQREFIKDAFKRVQDLSNPGQVLADARYPPDDLHHRADDPDNRFSRPGYYLAEGSNQVSK